MIVRLDASAINDENAFDDLDKIFPLLEEGRHRWYIVDAGEVRSSAWFAGHGARWQRRILVLLDTAKPIYESRRSVPRIAVGTDTEAAELEWCLSPSQAWDLLKRPLRLVVEDRESDGSFLRALLLRFGERRLERKLGQHEWQTVKERWDDNVPGDNIFFTLVHGGGSRIGDMIRQEWEASPAAMIAIVDSDRRSPSDSCEVPRGRTTWDSAVQAANNVKPVRISSTEWRPVVHVLSSRREVENYLPQEALKARYASGLQRRCGSV